MSRDQQRYRKNYSYYRPLPREGTITFAVDESLDWKNSVRAASTGNHALSGAGTSLAIGGVTVVDEDRVLLKNQLTSSQNGIYYFEVSGGNYMLSRASDASQGTLSSGAATYVEEGTNAGKIYILSTTGTITVDSTSLTWTEFTGGAGGSPGGSDTYVQFNDGGSFGGASGLRFNKTTGALTGTYVLATTGFSGSLTKLTDGTPCILAGPNITINTGSNGAVQITGSAGGVTGTGTGGYLPVWTSSTSLGDGPIRFLTPDIVAYDRSYHWFRESGSPYVYINSNSTTGGRIGINIDPSYPLHITQTSNPVAILEFARFRNTNSGAGSGVQQTYLAGNFSNPTFRITHTWPSNEQGHYTYFGIAKPTPSGTTTPEIVERVRLFSSGAIELSGSVTVRQDSEIASNKTVFDVQKFNGNQILWISSSAGTNSVGSDVFMFVSGSRTDDNTGADKVVFGGDVRISGSLSVGTGSVIITANNVQFGSSTMKIEKNGNDMKFFDVSNPGGLTLSELASGGGGSSPEYWISPTTGNIYTTGSVGIGKTSPSARLDILAFDGATGLIVRQGTSAPANGVPILNAQSFSGTSVLWVSGSGTTGARVGIGTTNPRATCLLDVGSKGGTGTNSYVSVNADVTGECGYSWSNGGADIWKFKRLALSSDISLAEDGGGNTALLCQYTTGNVGINTNNPSEKLHVNAGNIKVDTSGYGVRLASSSSNIDAQTLDCYYEVDFTVELIGSTYGSIALASSYNSVKMTRMGRTVHIVGDLRVSGKVTASGDLYVDINAVEPYAPNPAMRCAASVWLTGFASTLNEPIVSYMEAGGTRLYIQRIVNGVAQTDLADYINNGGQQIAFSVTYTV